MTPEPPPDAELEALLADLAEAWANVPASEPGDDVALAYARAAYARGYTRALEETADR